MDQICVEITGPGGSIRGGNQHPILRLLARGYLALVEHYSGNSALAKTWFSEVIEDLDTFGQSRSVAIFSRHLAELYRLGGEADRGRRYAPPTGRSPRPRKAATKTCASSSG